MINDCLLEFASLIGIIFPVYAEVTGMLELLLQLLVCNGDVHDLTDKRYFYIARSNCALSTLAAAGEPIRQSCQPDHEER